MCAISVYLKFRSRRFPGLNPQTSPLFLMPNGSALSRPEFIRRFKELLRSIGLNSAHYSGHSFRIRAATTAAKNGLPVYLIQVMGRWKSSAYQRYIQLPLSALAYVLTSLASSPSSS